MGVLHILNVLIIYKKNADHQKQQPSLSLRVEPAIHSISIVKLCYLLGPKIDYYYLHQNHL